MTDDSSIEDLERQIAELETQVEQLETELEAQSRTTVALVFGTVGYIGVTALLFIVVPTAGMAMAVVGLILAVWICLFRLFL